jgi:hypothetical protein
MRPNPGYRISANYTAISALKTSNFAEIGLFQVISCGYGMLSILGCYIHLREKTMQGRIFLVNMTAHHTIHTT